MLLLAILWSLLGIPTHDTSTLYGTVTDTDGHPISGAVIHVKSTQKGTFSNEEGFYKLTGDFEGEMVLQVSCIGYKSQTKKITIHPGEHRKQSFVLQSTTAALNEVVVSAKSKISEIEAMAYNVDVLDTKPLENLSISAGDALNRVAGVRVRKSGGVGSKMNLSINGFRGNQVKVFIDGVPMENFGSAFQLNNIPVDLAKRIEVYKGVVPINLGADALGGAINIVTDKYKKSHLDASYSYGSFNTHHTSLNAAYVAKSGFTAQVRAYQNYSDNDYKVTVDVANLNTGKYYPGQKVKRFHDMYHNETVIANIGVVNTGWADKFLIGLTLGQKYDEIQTGARLVSVFGAWHTEGSIIMPTLKYSKSNFLTEGLDVNITANYNLGEEKIIDTLHRRYNWFGDYISYDGPGGERNYSLYNYKNNNGIVTLNTNYDIGKRGFLSLSNVFNTFNRKGHDRLDPDNAIYETPKKTAKNILGLSYKYKRENWSATIFTKYYHQKNTYAESYNPTGNYGDIAYRHKVNKFDNLGYGIAGSYFINANLQLKASYEKSYRLPEANELFGNRVTLEGNIDLDPETSYNYNLGISYFSPMTKDNTYHLGGNIFYRDAKDFIRARLNKNQIMQVMDNLFNVKNMGVAFEGSYSFKNKLKAGVNMTYQDLRNNTKYVAGQSTESIVYKDRIPNIPYLYGNFNLSYQFKSPLSPHDKISTGYYLMYVHSFFLYWPSLGNKKFDVPYQISHNLHISYTVGEKEHLRMTLSCKNLTDNTLYDNFSLQKPGRNFTMKVSYAL